MVAHSSESIAEARKRLDSWVESFGDLFGNRIETCLWVTGTTSDLPSAHGSTGCVHFFEIPKGLDYYERTWKSKFFDSTWGLKSGPNFQFFAILSEMSRLHPQDWVLQLESDVFPLRAVRRDDLGIDFTNLWVVGALTHQAALPMLEEQLWSHINGAAFYHVGSNDFMKFLRGVWQTSLLYILHNRPDYAYDCLTSPPVWEKLPANLRVQWRSAQKRFATLPGMINMSSLSPTAVADLMSGFSPGIMPWLLHGPLEGHERL